MSTQTQSRMACAFDAVPIAYTISGAGSVALVFLHGGLADRTFWNGQHSAFSDRFAVVAPDLAGHGESGARTAWGLRECAKDVVAVIEAERLERVILIGNSLGGAVALETAALIGGRALGVIGVDTFHDLNPHIDGAAARELAERWRRDFSGALQEMIRKLFHPDAPAEVVSDVEHRMSKTSVDTVCAVFLSFGDYDMRVPARQLRAPLRCINGDLWPVNIQGVREIVSDFEVTVLPHTGHFPMLESPDAFNRALSAMVSLWRQPDKLPESYTPTSGAR